MMRAASSSTGLGVSSLVLAILLVSSGCEQGDSEDLQFPAEGIRAESPVWAVVDHLEYGRMVFYPEPDADWKGLLDMHLFEGLRPGMTFSDAQNALGLPDERGKTRSGPYWDYHRPLGTVRIAHDLKGSVPFLRWWRLKGFPKSAELRSVFHQSVARHIPETREDFEIVIMNNHRSAGALVKVHQGRVAWIDWVTDEN
jgi:hypothetical protein